MSQGLCAARFFGGADTVPLCLVLLGVLMVLHGLKLNSIWMSVTKAQSTPAQACACCG